MISDAAPASRDPGEAPLRPSWPRAYLPVGETVGFKVQPEDFVVDEVLAFDPDGAGEHLFLRIEKRTMETRRIARLLAERYGVAPIDVGYAGMKDKRAVTRQWYSVRTPVDGELPCGPGWRALEAGRHPRKLRRGQLTWNTFQVRLRGARGEGWRERLEVVASRGVPNYFGPQRFGRDNLTSAKAWLPQRRRRSVAEFKRALYLSVLRSYLFNEVLAARVRERSWNELLPGDVAESGVATGPLWGRGRSATGGVARALEDAALAPHVDICDGLEHAGLQQQRRALVLRPQRLEYGVEGADVLLAFRLPAGCYATTLLLEIFDLKTPLATGWNAP